jgi:hypothetical protein
MTCIGSLPAIFFFYFMDPRPNPWDDEVDSLIYLSPELGNGKDSFDALVVVISSRSDFVGVSLEVGISSAKTSIGQPSWRVRATSTSIASLKSPSRMPSLNLNHYSPLSYPISIIELPPGNTYLAFSLPFPFNAFLLFFSSMAFNLFLSSSLACRIRSASPTFASFLNSSGTSTLGPSNPNLPFSSC